MKTKKNHFSIAGILIAAALLASCGNADDGPKKDTEAETKSVETEEAGSGIASYYTKEIGEELGLEGFVCHVIQRNSGWACNDICSFEQTGDVFNDAVYNRTCEVEDKYGITFESTVSTDTHISELSTYILADDNSYDAAFPSAQTAGTFGAQRLLYNLNDLKYLDFSQDCWNTKFNDVLDFHGKLYYAAGTISTNAYTAIRTLYFNKKLVTDFELEDPYAAVREGKWTLDLFNTMAHAVVLDMNGDGKMETTDDQFGFVWQETCNGQVFMYGAGQQMTEMDADGYPVLSLGSERSVNVFNSIQKIIKDTNTFRMAPDDQLQGIFQEGRALFYAEVIRNAEGMRASEVDFGILPAPKYDEEQSSYISYVDGWCLSPLVIPTNVRAPETVGFIMELLAETGKEEIVPVYYDKCLNTKYLRDEESSEMLDIIFNNFILDNSELYNWSFIKSELQKAYKQEIGLATIVAKLQTKAKVTFQETINALEALE